MNNNTPLPSGEIFSGGNVNNASYQEALNVTQENEVAQALTDQPQDQPGAQVNPSNPEGSSGFPNYPSGNQQNIPPTAEGPPPFIEDKTKKFLIIGGVIVLLVIFIFLMFKFLSGRFARPPAQAKINLTYWNLWEEETVIRPFIDEFQKSHPNITVSYSRQDPKQYRERLQAAISRGEGPDLFRFHNTWVPMLLGELAPMPKTIYSDSDFEKIFYPVASESLKTGGNLYGIPLMIDGLLLFYNEDILKSANVPVPVTWVDVQNAVPKLTVKEDNRIVTSAISLGTAENIEHFSDILGLMMLQNGTQPVKSVFTCSDPDSSTCAVEALTFYRKFAETPNNAWDATLENSIVAFAGGKVAMILAPSWEAITIKNLSPNLNFKTAQVPQLPCDRTPCPTVNWASFWVEGVSAKSKNQEAAWEFLKYLSQPETMQKMYAEQVKLRPLFGEPYSRTDLAKILADNVYLAPLILSAPTMKSFYLASRTFDGETGLNTSLINYLKDAVNSLSQGTSVESALKIVDDGFKQVFARFNIAAPQ